MNADTIGRHAWAGRIAFLLGLLLVLYLGLLPSLLAGLLVHELVSVIVPLLRIPLLGRRGARLLAVALIAAVTIGLVAGSGVLVANLIRNNAQNVAALGPGMADIVDTARHRVPDWVLPYLPADLEQLRTIAVEWLSENADAFSVVGTDVGRGVTHIVIGMVIGALVVLDKENTPVSAAPLAIALRGRARVLGQAFRNVVFAQVWISAFNTLLTGLYLGVALPLFGVHVPFTKTLIGVTFVAGLVPILGNLVSNTVITVVSLSQSIGLAAASLGYLVVVHKLEYFLNARIIGGHIQARAWELLAAMLVMEAAFGVPGIIAAPVLYSYLKDELKEAGLL